MIQMIMRWRMRRASVIRRPVITTTSSGDGDYDLDVDNLTDFVKIFQDDTRFSEDVDIGDQDKQINHDNLPLASNQKHDSAESDPNDRTTHETSAAASDIIDNSYDDPGEELLITASANTASEESSVSTFDSSDSSDSSEEEQMSVTRGDSLPTTLMINSSSPALVVEKLAEENNGEARNNDEKYQKLISNLATSTASTTKPDPIFYETTNHSPTFRLLSPSSETSRSHEQPHNLSKSHFFNVTLEPHDEESFENSTLSNSPDYPTFYSENATEVIMIRYNELQRTPREQGAVGPEYEALEGPYQRLQATYGGWKSAASNIEFP